MSLETETNLVDQVDHVVDGTNTHTSTTPHPKHAHKQFDGFDDGNRGLSLSDHHVALTDIWGMGDGSFFSPPCSPGLSTK